MIVSRLSLVVLVLRPLQRTPNQGTLLALCLRTLVRPAARQTDNAAELPRPAPSGISLKFNVVIE